jgi:hypothetical protein
MRPDSDWRKRPPRRVVYRDRPLLTWREFWGSLMLAVALTGLVVLAASFAAG